MHPRKREKKRTPPSSCPSWQSPSSRAPPPPPPPPQPCSGLGSMRACQSSGWGRVSARARQGRGAELWQGARRRPQGAARRSQSTAKWQSQASSGGLRTPSSWPSPSAAFLSSRRQTHTHKENASCMFLFLFGLLASNALCCELLCGHDVRRLRGRCQVRGAWAQAFTCRAQQALLSCLMPAFSPPAWARSSHTLHRPAATTNFYTRARPGASSPSCLA